MKIVIAMDSFKGSMTSIEAGNAAKSGILLAFPDAEVTVLPLADGGEGTVEALIDGMNGNRIEVEVSDPLGRPTSCLYGILPDKIAVMEMAQAAGLTKLKPEERNPLYTSTYGVGEMIVDAIERGCRKFVIGIGGSATNDGGMGMLCALGYEFFDMNGKRLLPDANALSKVANIKAKNVHPNLFECEFQIACDVDNPLCGEYGATYVYGPQKGLDSSFCATIDEGMKHYASVVERFLFEKEKEQSSKTKDESLLEYQTQYCNYAGAGAAGGLGFAFLAFLNATLTSGVDLILDTMKIDEYLQSAQLVCTGEGKIDEQTAHGKAPVGLAKRAKKYGCRVYAFAGAIGEGADQCLQEGIDAYYAISEGVPLKVAMQREYAVEHMQRIVKSVLAEYKEPW